MTLSRLDWTRPSTIADIGPAEPPLRAEVLGVEALETYAHQLAASTTNIESTASADGLANRLRDNRRVLRICYAEIAAEVRQNKRITPAAEWIVDNFHLVEEQLIDLDGDLSSRGYRRLPQLIAGARRAQRRVYVIAEEFIAHTDSHFDIELVRRFLVAYQTGEPLYLREIWALPLVLRCALIENLRRLAVRIVIAQRNRTLADRYADAPLGSLNDAVIPEPVGPLHPAFISRLVQRLRDREADDSNRLRWLRARLRTEGTDEERAVQTEYTSQAAANLSVRNLLTSMRALALYDWPVELEGVSPVDVCLRQDATFGMMDFQSRDRYRGAVEELAFQARLAETEVAQAAVALASNAVEGACEAEQRDLGYYLIGAGRARLEHVLDSRQSIYRLVFRWVIAHATPAYLGALLLSTSALVAIPILASYAAGVGHASLLLLGFLALFPASDIAVDLVNRFIARTIGPRRLPRLDLSGGITPTNRTLVVIPTLLTSEASIEEQVERLLLHFLANPDANLNFVLLSDWVDADHEHDPTDATLLEIAVESIADLNMRYPAAAEAAPRFLLLHRKRQWSETQQRWLGWERKRGKLHELLRLLRGADDTSFIMIDGKTPLVPSEVRYVLTLDADTRLPLGAARQLIGTAAHPLNRPRIDPGKRRVVAGYGVLQPKVTASLPPARERSLYLRLFSGPAGLDPYTAPFSDAYQDLFGEGNFVGKGLLDVDAYLRVLDSRVPENAMLSHDLFEGLLLRCGLVTDVELFEDFPSHAEVAASRAHRWARGDWQLLPWLLGRGRRGISWLGRWKLFDNLRRSLSAPAMLFLLVACWSIPGVPPQWWIGFVGFALLFPALLAAADSVSGWQRAKLSGHQFRIVGANLGAALAQAVVALTLLAHHAWLMLDAIARTLYRLGVSRRNLLEWVTAAQAKSRANFALGNFVWPLRGASVMVVAATAAVLIRAPTQWWIAAPFVMLWWLSPLVARGLSLPAANTDVDPLTRDNLATLSQLARRTWRFFELVVTETDHALPPDNFQEEPQPVIAHRSSPTNFGLYLLSITAARDFGWIGHTEMVERLEATFATLERLPRFRGHFYNWYETRELRPLDPLYVSTVDGGNLAGHLLTLAMACREYAADDAFEEWNNAGLLDDIELLRAALRSVPTRQRHGVEVGDVEGAIDALEQLLVAAPMSPRAWSQRWPKLAAQAADLAELVRLYLRTENAPGAAELIGWADALLADVRSHARDSNLLTRPEPESTTNAVRHALQQRLQVIATRAEAWCQAMDFSFLYDSTRQLFSIGYRVADDALDASVYDLLASEARLASFIAIAEGHVPVLHWTRLSRLTCAVANQAALVSWSGSMFEYLMPSLVMYTPSNSLLDRSCRLVIQHQKDYGAQRAVPWGVSESAYNLRDHQFSYQYSAFGVPGLGLKRGLSEDLVVAPYATALAAMYDPHAAIRNFRELEALGARGSFGFYEALDFTPARLPEGARFAVVRAYMAHHQGMSLVALANVAFDGIMRRRFHRQPLVRAAELLLQERAARLPSLSTPPADNQKIAETTDLAPPVVRAYTSPHQPIPACQLLSNSRYTVMITAAGGGYSQLGTSAITRWREDPTRDCWGSFIYLRDTADGTVFSAAYQPVGVEADAFEIVFAEDRVRLTRRDGTLSTNLEIMVSPEDDAEIRKLSITNNGKDWREIDVTSYAEIVLAPMAADLAHPAFSNLFVHTEYAALLAGLLAHRRPRSTGDAPLWTAHLLAGAGAGIQFETDRARFLGRGRNTRAPAAVMDGQPLSNTVGAVLDPIFSLRTTVRIAPGAVTHLVFSLIVAPSREALLVTADKYRDPAIFERISNLAWTHSRVRLHHLGIEPEEADTFQFLATRLLYSDPQARPSSERLQLNTLSKSALWRLQISGDHPLVLLRLDRSEDRILVRQLLRAQQYWRSKGLIADVVILNEEAASYLSAAQLAIDELVRLHSAGLSAAQVGGVYVLRATDLSADERVLLLATARVIVVGRGGSLAEQARRIATDISAPPRPPLRPSPRSRRPTAPPPRRSVEFDNGFGGFADEGREYVITLTRGRRTPLPWINVIANPTFGFQISEAGTGYTWSLNSHENQLTPWRNDPVSDGGGEAFYLQDQDSGALWSPTCYPIYLEDTQYIVRHGQGYSIFEHAAHGIATALAVFVSPEEPLRIAHFSLTNESPRARRVTVTAYLELLLGTNPAEDSRHVVTEFDRVSNVFLARNPWARDFAGLVMFAGWTSATSQWTANRREFIGRNGSLQAPAALLPGVRLSGQTGAGLDPCAALQISIELPPGHTAQATFVCGQAADRALAQRLFEEICVVDPVQILAQVRAKWEGTLSQIRIETPDPAFNILVNRWLLYQVLACRMWGRAGFYQAGGAYGFRDQLQDSLALLTTEPKLTREQILRAAAHQFVEGDVQHWWHPPSGRGVRTRCSDDRLWLPFAVAHYLAVTADAAVLDESLPFLTGPPLSVGQEDAYFEPAIADEQASLFEHCARAIECSLALGAHDLPLIGTGDWNDGMNRIGHGGSGESVWLGWFLYTVLTKFVPLAEARGATDYMARWAAHAVRLIPALDASWDGAWYRRAYFDDGTPLGSSVATECRIDSIVQSWSVLSTAGTAEHARHAMRSVQEYLVRPGDDLALLFTPPFDGGPTDPGYIKAYPPGVRENGGQYTHAATWCVIAFAMQGDGDRAGDLFNLLNPINHANSTAAIHGYKVEPYVVAADIYSQPPHVRRGGWTWYTGAAGWLYRAAIEYILGLQTRGAGLRIDPCIPRHWPSFVAHYRHGNTRYAITVVNPHGATHGVATVILDNAVLERHEIPLVDDGKPHTVQVTLGSP